MSHVVITRYLGPTAKRPARVKATIGTTSLTLTWDHALDADNNHAAAARALVIKIGLYGAAFSLTSQYVNKYRLHTVTGKPLDVARPFRDDERCATRGVLTATYRTWRNDFLTFSAFAEWLDVPTHIARALVEAGRELQSADAANTPKDC